MIVPPFGRSSLDVGSKKVTRGSRTVKVESCPATKRSPGLAKCVRLSGRLFDVVRKLRGLVAELDGIGISVVEGEVRRVA